MTTIERRKFPRLKKSFQVQLIKEGLEHYFQGICVNLSQGGAFIKIDKWLSFHAKDRAEIAFLLPPEFTGQEKIIRLTGGAVILRVDHINKGIAVEFTTNLRQFEPVNFPPKFVDQSIKG